MPDSHKILIVDDHPIVRRGLVQLIAERPGFTVAGEADEPGRALQLFDEIKPDLTIVDLMLRSGSGMSLIKQLKSRCATAKILVLSLHAEELFAEHVLRMGALGYINKQEATEKLGDAMTQVLSGRVYLSSPLSDRILSRVANGPDDFAKSQFDNLTDRELEVFRMIGHGQTTRQIAGKLHLSPKTIETYRENLKRKLNLGNATELTHRAVLWVLEERPA